MTLRTFKKLRLQSQLKIFNHSSAPVTILDTSTHRIYMKKICGFYIEVYYSLFKLNEVEKLTAFKTAKRLEPYVFRKTPFTFEYGTKLRIQHIELKSRVNDLQEENKNLTSNNLVQS